jgi:inosine-uridine nucleoside N-ribohydrolase
MRFVQTNVAEVVVMGGAFMVRVSVRFHSKQQNPATIIPFHEKR